jgi:hypothetical protein
MNQRKPYGIKRDCIVYSEQKRLEKKEDRLDIKQERLDSE